VFGNWRNVYGRSPDDRIVTARLTTSRNRENGEVRSTRINSGLESELDALATAAVQRWRFYPAFCGVKPF
jgi:hypothetical protein